MKNEQTRTFKNWTEYDDWLVQNYGTNAIYSVNEVNGSIEIKFCPKADFAEETKQSEKSAQ